MTAANGFQPGDRVEVRQLWAHGHDAAWFGGYEVVDDQGVTVLVRDLAPGSASSEVTRWSLDSVRLAFYGPKLPPWWQRRQQEGGAATIYRGWKLDRY